MSSKDPAWISDWNPEDEKFWNSKGKIIARRNLIWSIVAEHMGFSVWLTWSVVATKLPQARFHYTTDQLFQLVALPGLIGSLMRFPYTFCSDHVWRPQLDNFQRLRAIHPEPRTRVFRNPTRHTVLVDVGGGSHCRGLGAATLPRA